MKHFLFKIFLIFIYLFVIQNVYALEFEKSVENPLKIDYINDYVNLLQANIFKEGSLYKGIFVIGRATESYYSLGYFVSDNGIDWMMKKEILNVGTDLSNPSVIKTQTGYFLFISHYDDNAVYKIYSSSCDFEFNCSKDLLPVIIPNTKNNSEKNGVFAGHPYQQGSRTYLFFGAWGGDGFKIKLAFSDDLTNWQRCPGDNAFLYGGDGPFPYLENDNLFLFFHHSDASGIKLAKTSLPITCDSIFESQGYLLTKNKDYDLKHLIFPSIINDNGNLKLFYSGLGNDGRWYLNLACTGQTCLSPTSIPTLIAIPTLTLQPVNYNPQPLIIIPGFMASWNKEAILHNKEVTYDDWKLLSFVKEYDGLTKTLINIGYEKDKNLFIFPFDWRRSIDKTRDDLNNFLQNKIWSNHTDQKVNLVGHSLGGLIARTYTQNHKERINKVVTIGSPHQGVVQVYKPLEAGEIDRDNTFLWLSEKIILVLNKSTVENDRVTIENKFSVAKDLFPTFDFLKNSSGDLISVSNMLIKNNRLDSYNQTFSEIFPLFTAIFGEKDKNTPAGFIVEPQSQIDKLLGNYSDGKPYETYFDLGDYTVLSKSSSQDADTEKLNFDHGELIYKKDGIKKILDILKIKYDDSQIVEGKGTKIDPSLIFLIKSPATMEVEFNNNIYNEEDGIIFIPDAQSGNYNLKVKGTDKGKYEVVIGQISEKNDLWESINGETDVSQIDDYNILYNDKTAVSIFQMITPTVICTRQACLSPTVISTVTPTPTGQIYLLPTAIPILTPIPHSTNSPPEILGTSSFKVAKKDGIKNLSIWDFISRSLIVSSLTIIIFFSIKKLSRNK